jgi:molybdopterin-containing oxidoreductase family iron-sulfur binding subunit
MKGTKKYWKGLEQLENKPEFQKRANKEFPEYLPLSGGEDGESSRRDFLKLMGFGIAAASLAACEAPIRKAIPYVKKPATVDPSLPNYYASSYVNGSDYCSVVVKTREGRPIKIQGNTLSSISGGGTSAQVEASVLSLYDQERLKNPLVQGFTASWEELDAAVLNDLQAASNVTIVSNSVASPSTLAAIEQFKTTFGASHIAYDQASFSGLLSAYEAAFGNRMMPWHDFSKAKTIVSFGADFLGNWPNVTGVNKQYASTRKLSSKKKDMSRLYAFESNLSLTGANADYRTPIKASQQGAYVANLYNLLASKVGAPAISAPAVEDDAYLVKAANDLADSKGKSLVLSGSNDKNVQSLVIAINDLLGNFGSTIDTTKAINTRKGDDAQFAQFVQQLNAGTVGGVIFYNCNPVYDHPMGAQLKAGLENAAFVLSTSDRKDETSSLAKYQAPDHHFLESWNDFEPVTGFYSLSQPAIKNIFNTRQAQESFLKWSGSSTSYYDFVRSNWNTNVFSKANTVEYFNFDSFWDKCLQDGVFEAPAEAVAVTPTVDVVTAASGLPKGGDGYELVLYFNNSVADGTQANNPWLQEMPDPITKATWDNYLTVSPKMANEWGIEFDDMKTQTVNLTANGKTVEIPVLAQPGQADGTIGLAMGYGRESAGKVANGVGVNAYPFAIFTNGSVNYALSSGVTVEPTGNTYSVAQTQTSQTYMGRETVIQETVLKKYQEDPQAGRHFPKIATAEGYKKPNAISLWQGHEYPNHHWGMMIDLNSCTGCGACTIACQTENNIPVVGKAEVLNRREMHWIRIDRYYSSSATEADGRRAMEKAGENPEVTFQPMMCQQCNNAPCETVCPVAATTHSTEGLNQMTYNRCIGTRYCANNCPYKVRRFNWFKYHDNTQFDKNMAMNNDLGKMVLNPDVTVRARGVMEKCTFCVQRIQSGKLEAKREGRRPEDGEVNTACASACPSEALVFGDMKDPNSRVSQMLQIKQEEKMVEAREPRAYHVLEEIRVMPNIWYLTKVRNKDEEAENA